MYQRDIRTPPRSRLCPGTASRQAVVASTALVDVYKSLRANKTLRVAIALLATVATATAPAADPLRLPPLVAQAEQERVDAIARANAVGG